MNEPTKPTSWPVVFLHGLESAPWGRKSIGLRDAGFDVRAPDGQGCSLAARIDAAVTLLEGMDVERTVLVGSSYGGAAAVVTAARLAEAGRTIAGVVLCAPALYLPEPPLDASPPAPVAPTWLVHGRADDIVPIAWSRRWASEHFAATLFEVEDGHRLSDSLPTIVRAVELASR